MVLKDACLGLSLTLCTIFKIYSQFSENAIFEKFVRICLFRNFIFSVFCLVHHAVHMQAINWLKI